MGLQERDHTIYANIIGDGSIRVASSQQDPKAVLRQWELKDGTKGEKWERKYSELSGIIKSIRFDATKFGERMAIVVNDGDDITLCMPVDSKYADDTMKRLPALNLTQRVAFKPYNFEDKNGKLTKGMSITQEGNKIADFFSGPAPEHKKLHGFPNFPKDIKLMKTADWKIYFLQTGQFLREFTENNIIPTLDVSFDTTKPTDVLPEGEMPQLEPTSEELVIDKPVDKLFPTGGPDHTK